MLEFLDWLSRASGVVAALLALTGYMFREKWRQILKRSLSEDLERLKADLQRAAAEHAASLAPALEQVKHDFQQKLETYKVSLIAQAEAAKSQSELRKNIAMRFSEIEFERLVALELELCPLFSQISSWGSIEIAHKTFEHFREALLLIDRFNKAESQAEMFLSIEQSQALLTFRQELLSFINSHVGSGKPGPTDENKSRARMAAYAAVCHCTIKDRIRALGTLT